MRSWLVTETVTYKVEADTEEAAIDQIIARTDRDVLVVRVDDRYATPIVDLTWGDFCPQCHEQIGPSSHLVGCPSVGLN